MKFIKNTDKPPISETEIREHMNFDKFISSYTPPVKGFFSGVKGYILYGCIAAGAIAIALVVARPANSPARVKPFVLSPMKTMDAPFRDFTVSASRDSTLLFETGSFISVPAGAFEDENDNTVEGDVQIHYREFHDAIDILLSGIPMNYDSAGTHYQFESGGMFEIRATKNGKQVRLKKGKELKINMISNTAEPNDFNFYSLDTVARKWNYVSENTVSNNTCIRAYEERVPGTVAKMNVQAPAEAPLHGDKPVMPLKADPALPNFRIDFDAEEFPELQAFTGIKFQPLKGDKGYDPGLAKKTWEEVEVKRGKNADNYVVKFTSGKESHHFTVVPVVEEKDLAAAMADFEVRQRNYETLLAERKHGAQKGNDSLYRLNARFMNMAASGDLERRFSNFMNNTYTETSRDLLAYRTFSISKLGVWNCDRPLPFFLSDFRSRIGELKAQFKNSEGQDLELTNVFFIRRSFNGIYMVKPENFNRFPFNKDEVDVMIGITDDNQLMYLKDEELRAAEIKDKNILFRMKKAPDEIVKAEELKKFLRL
jgi:hypothetical protein